MENLIGGFITVFQPATLAYCFIGAFLGTVVGILPGLGPLTTIAILLPITFKMDVTSAIIMLSGIYYGVAYGGTVTSVLMRIPGEASSVVTCLDGYEMARKGRAGAALCIAGVGSFVAGTIGVVAITFLSPPLAAGAGLRSVRIRDDDARRPVRWSPTCRAARSWPGRC
jgi:putative tricarboxylic transport membrane protein